MSLCGHGSGDGFPTLLPGNHLLSRSLSLILLHRICHRDGEDAWLMAIGGPVRGSGLILLRLMAQPVDDGR